MKQENNWSLLAPVSILAELVEVREFSKRFSSLILALRCQNSHSASTSHWGLRKGI